MIGILRNEIFMHGSIKALYIISLTNKHTLLKQQHAIEFHIGYTEIFKNYSKIKYSLYLVEKFCISIKQIHLCVNNVTENTRNL